MTLIGCCSPIEDAAQVQAAGFDYIETTVVRLAAEADEAAFAAQMQQYRSSPVPIRSCNVFLPGDLKIVGPSVERDRVQAYVERALRRVQAVGAQLVVFGSGGARRVPEGFPRDQAMQQLAQFLHTVADQAELRGITIAIEPLNRKECNILNSVAEAVELAELVDRKPVRVLADFYHLDEEHEPIEHLVRYGEWIAHIHVADSGRRAPGMGQYPYAEFAAALRQIGYRGMVSVECPWGDFAAEAPAAVQFLRRTFGGDPW